MCYLIAKDVNKIGCYAVEMEMGQHLASFERKLLSEVNTKRIQLVTISRPSAYGEYEPYTFTDTEDEFEEKVKELSEDTYNTKSDLLQSSVKFGRAESQSL